MKKLLTTLFLIFFSAGWNVLPGQCEVTLNSNKKLQKYQQDRNESFIRIDKQMAEAVEKKLGLEKVIKPFELPVCLMEMEEYAIESICSPSLMEKCKQMVQEHRGKFNQLFEKYIKNHEDFPPLSPDYKERVVSFIKDNLVDPYSLKIEFSGTNTKQYKIEKKGIAVGWSVTGNFNAKNRM